MGAKVDYQAAAPAETRTPNLHRAKIAQKRVRMEGWRQRRLGSKTRNSQGGRRKTDLTLTGLLMEGLSRVSDDKFRVADNPGVMAGARIKMASTATCTIARHMHIS